MSGFSIDKGEKCPHSVSTSNHHWYSNVHVLLSLRLLQVCNPIKILLMLMLILVSPVKTDSLFEWKKTTNPVISTVRQRIALKWIYKSKQPVNSMIFTRFRNSSDTKVPVGEWTKEGGFKPDPFISTELTLIAVDKSEQNEKKVSLILENPIHIDYGLQYNCEVNGGEVPGNNLSIELIALRPIWTHTEVEKHAILRKDVTFRWEYKYPYKAIVVFISRENNSEMIEVGYWYQGDFTDLGQFNNRVDVRKTPYENQTGEMIRVTLQNVSVEDYGWEYICQLTLGDGEQLLTRTVLKEEEVKPNFVTPRTDSRTSAATKSPVGYSTVILLVIATSIISQD
ncbi:hypothetical protein SNE40_006187 [Patella caerulea]|uniref:Uncharacterized protein n=1 Tax=Patella caerulea TaxID=87958 RepID=A0AAN8JZV5_PATCE